MKQIRHQLLSKTYQQLSTLLCQTAFNIQSTDYTVPAAWASLIQDVQHTCALFEKHAATEEATLFPILQQYEPALAAILRDDQCNRMRYISDLCTLFTNMQAANDKQKSRLFSHKLLYRFNEFVAATLQQMKEHEYMINAVLWNYYNDNELVQMAAVISLSAPKKNTIFADNIIYNMVPAPAASTFSRTTRTGKTYNSHRASKALALAV